MLVLLSKKIEIATAVRCIVIVFSLAILPPIFSMGVAIVSSLDPNSANFNPLGKAFLEWLFLSSYYNAANKFVY